MPEVLFNRFSEATGSYVLATFWKIMYLHPGELADEAADQGSFELGY
jgi:hypothetical protein